VHQKRVLYECFFFFCTVYCRVSVSLIEWSVRTNEKELTFNMFFLWLSSKECESSFAVIFSQRLLNQFKVPFFNVCGLRLDKRLEILEGVKCYYLQSIKIKIVFINRNTYCKIAYSKLCNNHFTSLH